MTVLWLCCGGSGADWCLQSDGVPDSRLQGSAGTPGSIQTKARHPASRTMTSTSLYPTLTPSPTVPDRVVYIVRTSRRSLLRADWRTNVAVVFLPKCGACRYNVIDTVRVPAKIPTGAYGNMDITYFHLFFACSAQRHVASLFSSFDTQHESRKLPSALSSSLLLQCGDP